MKTTVKLLLICQLLILPTQCNEDNPFLDLASAFLENMGDGNNANGGDGIAALGSIVGTLMQGDNAKNLGAMLGQAAGNNGDGAGNGMAALGSIVGTLMQGDNAKNLGAMLGGGQGENNAGDILSGIGSLLGGGEGEKPKLDPKLIGSMVSMFAKNMMGKPKEPKREKREKRESQNAFKASKTFDLESMLNLASGLMGTKDGGGFLPLIVNAIGTLSDSAAEKRAEEHKDHATFLPPFLEKLHLYWDLFINSELGKSIYEKSGMRTVLKAFTGADGSLSFEKMLKNFENQSFRRHWIKAAAKYLTDFVVNVAKPEVYQRYLGSAQFLVNSFLTSQGLPENTHLNAKNPEKSITVLVNFVLKKYMDIETDVSEYIKPAIVYTKQTLEMAEKATKSMANRANYNALLDRLTDTLNLEIIEPVLRVYRAYKHSVEAPHCQEHLMCLVNRNPEEGAKGLPGFKAGLTKLSSLAASAALSFQNGKSFWDLYNAIQNDVNCEAAYPADCSAFHEHEMKVTTEVYHSEL